MSLNDFCSANFKQKNTVFQPTASLKIDSLSVNEVALGKLNLDISSDETLTKFYINSNLDNENVEAFNAKGNVQIRENQTFADIDLNFDKRELLKTSKSFNLFN